MHVYSRWSTLRLHPKARPRFGGVFALEAAAGLTKIKVVIGQDKFLSTYPDTPSLVMGIAKTPTCAGAFEVCNYWVKSKSTGVGAVA